LNPSGRVRLGGQRLCIESGFVVRVSCWEWKRGKGKEGWEGVSDGHGLLFSARLRGGSAGAFSCPSSHSADKRSKEGKRE